MAKDRFPCRKSRRMTVKTEALWRLSRRAKMSPLRRQYRRVPAESLCKMTWKPVLYAKLLW